MKGVRRFCEKEKLSPWYVGPYLIFKRVGNVSYELEFPSSLSSIHPVFHVSLLRKCMGDLSLVVPLDDIGISGSLSYEKVLIYCGLGLAIVGGLSRHIIDFGFYRGFVDKCELGFAKDYSRTPVRWNSSIGKLGIIKREEIMLGTGILGSCCGKIKFGICAREFLGGSIISQSSIVRILIGAKPDANSVLGMADFSDPFSHRTLAGTFIGAVLIFTRHIIIK
ncbi:putative uroporphyrinogen decarboxylase, chloroplastic-like [Capsicum annuum]|nr:putative uroporphyrinogen decarboxylase, chloroplastic-like [Capsicum annuum]KAF3654637.1 putative uroporphyrinogen decarboxylase, chloroplastic-like [Capsicum annuum]